MFLIRNWIQELNLSFHRRNLRRLDGQKYIFSPPPNFFLKSRQIFPMTHPAASLRLEL
jgi:hypothetical protein